MGSWQNRHKVVPAVYIVLRRDDGQVFLMRRFNTGYCDGQYSLPAGHLDGNESSVTAAIREAKEEAGVDIEPKNLKLVHVMHRMAQERDHERMDLYFEATEWAGEPDNLEPHKCDHVCWSSPADLPEQIIPEVRSVLRSIAEENYYSDANF